MVAVVAGILTASLAVSMVDGMPALAAPARGGPSGPSRKSVPVTPVKAHAATRSQTDGPGLTRLDHRALPAGGAADVAVSGTAVSVGGLPVTASVPAPTRDSADVRDGHAPAARTGAVHVQVADRSVADSAGVHGGVLSVAPADGGGAAPVHLRLDYSSFSNAWGGDFGNRLRLVPPPARGPTTPTPPQRPAHAQVN